MATEPMNEASRLAAGMTEDYTAPHEKGLHEGLADGRLAVVEVALVERLVAALKNRPCSVREGNMHMKDCVRCASLAVAKAAGFGKVP